MARTPRSGAPTNRPRPTAVAKPAASGAGSVARTATIDPPRRRTHPLQFLREVRIEARKIVWTSWKETWITSVMVLIMVILSVIFFFLVDSVLSNGLRYLFRLPEILS